MAGQLRPLLLTGSALWLLCATVPSPALAAFDPNEGAEATEPTSKNVLPDPKLLYTPANRGGTANIAPSLVSPLEPITTPRAPLYTPYVGSTAPLAPAAPPVVATAPGTAKPEVLGTISSPAPIAGTAPAPVATATAAFPSPATPTEQAGFIAPAPLIAPTPMPAQTPAPASASLSAPVPVPAPLEPPSPAAPPLASQTKAILSRIPSKLDTPKPAASSKLAMDRMNPGVKLTPAKEGKDASYEAAGLSIKVRRPGLDTNFELNRAYTSLMGGDIEGAIETYKNIVAAEPTNQDALFGLAAIYHRAGDVERARPYYGALLKVNPNHREGLNNFLVLVSDESPQEALAELDRLEQRNPNFSPIPAQQAAVLNKLGFADQARSKMMRAIELAPDNLTYRYNLAVLLDQQGNYSEAAALYKSLITASLRGETLPATTESMQKRLNYISTSGKTPVDAL